MATVSKAVLEALAEIEDYSPPLTLGEALGVAEQIRKWPGTGVDRKYWPGVIEQLCKQVAQREALLRRLAGLRGIDAGDGGVHYASGEVEDLIAEALELLGG